MVFIGWVLSSFSVVEGLGVVNDRCRSSMLAADPVLIWLLEAIADLDLFLRVLSCVGRIDNMLNTAAEDSAKVWQLMLRVTICRATHRVDSECVGGLAFRCLPITDGAHWTGRSKAWRSGAAFIELSHLKVRRGL